jgi:hypothetical protein
VTEPHPRQPPWGISGPADAYPQVRDQVPYGAQNPYGHPAQPPQYPYDQGPPPQYPGGPAPQNPYGPPRRGSRRPVIFTVPFALLIVAGAAGLLVLLHHLGSAPASKLPQGTIDVTSLRPGDCFEKPLNPSVPFSSLKAVSCTSPHNAQAFYSFTYPGARSGLPSDDELKADAEPRCADAADTRIDQARLPQNARPGLIFADDGMWAQGYHAITCVYENDTDFTGSFVKG